MVSKRIMLALAVVGVGGLMVVGCDMRDDTAPVSPPPPMDRPVDVQPTPPAPDPAMTPPPTTPQYDPQIDRPVTPDRQDTIDQFDRPDATRTDQDTGVRPDADALPDQDDTGM